uniref:Uncharacterized protein n=1 Tax=Candidatus Kentrum sp. FM TaxID=2126340 RepID=A0A450SZY5_9GAMM|nr:MAG: hypothetical protein BECKFM1743A_GA0114220_102472 [Candidatus Kentron sp. FM]
MIGPTRILPRRISDKVIAGKEYTGGMGECLEANTRFVPTLPPNVGANLVFALRHPTENNLPKLRSLGHIKHSFSFARRQAYSELCNCHCNTEAGREGVNQSVISRGLGREGEAPAEPLENRSNPLRLGRSLALPERPRLVAARPRCTTIRPFLVFYVRFS